MAVVPLSVMYEREKVIDFVHPFMEDGVGILLKRPTGDANKMAKVFLPFHATVWCLIVTAILIVGILLYFVNRTTPYSGKKTGHEDATCGELCIRENMWMIFASFIEQGGLMFFYLKQHLLM